MYNVPVGAYKNPTICDDNNLKLVSDKLKNVDMTVGDYHSIKNFIDKNTFLYFDPPYRPLTKTAGFTAYNAAEFNDYQQTELGEFIKEVANNGAWVLASNSDPKNIDENDNFFEDLYSPLNIYRVDARRSINSLGKGRGKVKELLISSY